MWQDGAKAPFRDQMEGLRGYKWARKCEGRVCLKMVYTPKIVSFIGKIEGYTFFTQTHVIMRIVLRSQ